MSPLVVHALENRGRRADQTRHFVDDWRRDGRGGVLPQPPSADQQFGERDGGGLVGKLIDALPDGCLRRQADAVGVGQNLAGDVQVVVYLLLDCFVLCLNKVVDSLRDVIQVGLDQSVHFRLRQPVVLPALPDCQRQKGNRRDQDAADAQKRNLGAQTYSARPTEHAHCPDTGMSANDSESPALVASSPAHLVRVLS